ncbi:hypothetical protein SHEWT2PL_00018 [Shewanella hafniensis]|uniref:Plasmid recombination enzyme n=1 Tax=Shewanella hafniensis TaxID=365590 RepID=A0ABM8N7U4_9GAMM|nr:hypothetical protein SHEWT2PL_00018 [Shewanella hafniensis]
MAVNRSLKHAFRDQETPNANADLRAENSAYFSQSRAEALEKYADRLPEKVRKNAVHCIEYLVTASPEAMQGKGREAQDSYFEDAIAWLQAKHGAENVIHAGIHRDETTPHLYAYVVPIDQKGSLNCRAFLGGAKALSDMQSDFAEVVGAKHGLVRGLEGSKAKHTTIQHYYAKLENVANDIEKVTKSIEISPEDLKPQSVQTDRGTLLDKFLPKEETPMGVSWRLNAKVQGVIAPIVGRLRQLEDQNSQLQDSVKSVLNGSRFHKGRSEILRGLSDRQIQQIEGVANGLRAENATSKGQKHGRGL